MGDTVIHSDNNRLLLQSGAGFPTMVIDDLNRVRIGANFSNARLDVENMSGNAIYAIAPGYGVIGTSTANNAAGVWGYASAASGVNFGVIGRSDSPAGYDFYASGAGQNHGSSSSIRWKHNIQPMDQPLEMVARLRGVYFDWNEDHGGHHDFGMIAEEVGKVLPEIVNYEKTASMRSGWIIPNLRHCLSKRSTSCASKTKALSPPMPTSINASASWKSPSNN